MCAVLLERYPNLHLSIHAQAWLKILENLGRASNTLDAYARGLDIYLRYCADNDLCHLGATHAHIAQYVNYLSKQPNLKGQNIIYLESGAGLANATIQQRITVIRLYYDYLVEEGLCPKNPVERGRYTSGTGFGGGRKRGLVPRYEKLPWIPSDEDWMAIVQATLKEPLRNRLMLALGYDAALRREEVSSIEIGDIDPAHKQLRIRAEITKNRRERIVPFSLATSRLYISYTRYRRTLSREEYVDEVRCYLSMRCCSVSTK